jgi:hypothetical protein
MFLDHRPDIILHDTDPKTIIAVAGIRDDRYKRRLNEKRETYTTRGYRYVEWDGVSPIQL